jgi:tRNA(adenine34) deaminase
MREALSWAKRGLEAGELPIGAVVVADDAVVAGAHTSERSSRRLLVHAELSALQIVDAESRAARSNRSLTLYTTVEPCLMCLGASISMFVGRIVFGLEAPGDGATNMSSAPKRDDSGFRGFRSPELTAGVLREASRDLFGTYVAARTSDHGGLVRWARELVATTAD